VLRLDLHDGKDLKFEQAPPQIAALGLCFTLVKGWVRVFGEERYVESVRPTRRNCQPLPDRTDSHYPADVAAGVVHPDGRRGHWPSSLRPRVTVSVAGSDPVEALGSPDAWGVHGPNTA